MTSAPYDYQTMKGHGAHGIPGTTLSDNGHLICYPWGKIKTLPKLLDMSIATLSARLHKIKNGPGWCYYCFQEWYQYRASDAEKRHIRRSWNGSLFWLTGISDFL